MSRRTEAEWDRIIRAVTEYATLNELVRDACGRMVILLQLARKSGELPPQTLRVEDDGALTVEWWSGEDRRVATATRHGLAEAEFRAGRLVRHERQAKPVKTDSAFGG